MDTNVPTVESGEEVSVAFEGNFMPRPEALENSDVALFKQQMSQVNPIFEATTPASKLTKEREQTKDLLDLSHEFKTFLEGKTSPVNSPNGLPRANQGTPLSHKELSLQAEIFSSRSGAEGKTINVPTNTHSYEASAETNVPVNRSGTEGKTINVPANTHSYEAGAETNVPVNRSGTEGKTINVSTNTSLHEASANTSVPVNKPEAEKGEISIPTGTSFKSVPTKEVGTKFVGDNTIPLERGTKTEYSDTKLEPLKKEVASVQDNPYVVPIGTPLISHPTSIQNAENIEAHAAMISQRIKDQIIDRILVSTNDIAANKTVKVVLNPTVLEGTEVNFQKVGDTLSVQFVSRNEGSLQFLQVNQADLQGYLQNELKQFKGVSVSVEPNENSTESPEDGRSRNRYEYQSQDEDEQ